MGKIAALTAVAVLSVALALPASAGARSLSKDDAFDALRGVAAENMSDGLASNYVIDWCHRKRGRYHCRVRAFDVNIYDNDTESFYQETETYRPIVYRDRDGDVMVRSSGLCGYGLSPCMADSRAVEPTGWTKR